MRLFPRRSIPFADDGLSLHAIGQQRQGKGTFHRFVLALRVDVQSGTGNNETWLLLQIPSPLPFRLTTNPALDSSIMPVGDKRGRPKWEHRSGYYVTTRQVDAHVPTNTTLASAMGDLVYGFPGNVEMDAKL